MGTDTYERRLNYHIATSLDGYVAHPDGSFDGFVMEGPHVADYLETISCAQDRDDCRGGAVTTRPPLDDEHSTRDPLDSALATLSVVDLDPLVARAQYVAAEARLTRTRVLSTRYERREPGLLFGLAGLHLAWALLRVFAG